MATYKKSSAGIHDVGDNGWNGADLTATTTDVPTDFGTWTDLDTGTNVSRQAFNSFKGHENFIQQTFDGLPPCRWRCVWDAGEQTSGTMEFYMATANIVGISQLDVYDGATVVLGIRINNGDFEAYIGGAWTSLVLAASNNQWYHISLRWESTAGAYQGLAEDKFKVFVDGTEYGDYAMVAGDPDRFEILGGGASIIYWDALSGDWVASYDIGDNLALSPDVTILAKNVLTVIIEQEIMNYPKASVILEESEIIGQGLLFQVTDMYSVDGASASNIIFEGQVNKKMDNYPFEMTLESRASEAGAYDKKGIPTTGSHAGRSDQVLDDIRNDLCDYIVAGDQSAGTAMGTRIYAGDKDIFSAWRNLALFQGWIFYYKEAVADTSIKLDFNAGDIDTGVSITQASNIWEFKAGQARQYFTKVIVQGEIGSTMGNAQSPATVTDIYGIVPFTQRDASLTTALCGTAATNILDVLDNDPMLVEFFYQDATIGYIQPGQYITFSYNLDGVTPIESQTFIVTKIIYNPISGVGQIWASSQIIYSYKVINYASTQLPMENSELIQQNASNVVDLTAALMIGASNSAWIPCAFETDDDTSKKIFGALGRIRNVDATDVKSLFLCPLPTNRGVLKLYIKGTKIEVFDSDATDYIDRLRLAGHIHTGNIVLQDIDFDTVHGTGTGSFTDAFAADDLSGYVAASVTLNLICATSQEVETVGVLLDCYYDT